MSSGRNSKSSPSLINQLDVSASMSATAGHASNTTATKSEQVLMMLAPSIKKITITRCNTGYGFTLSRYIIYSDDACQSYLPVKSQDSGKSGVSSSSFQPNKETAKSTVEIVFVKHVRSGGAAYLAGLREGDRIVFINGISLHEKNYADVISIIENSGHTLDLIVIPASLSSGSKSNEQGSSSTASGANSVEKGTTGQPSLAAAVLITTTTTPTSQESLSIKQETSSNKSKTSRFDLPPLPQPSVSKHASSNLLNTSSAHKHKFSSFPLSRHLAAAASSLLHTNTQTSHSSSLNTSPVRSNITTTGRHNHQQNATIVSNIMSESSSSNTSSIVEPASSTVTTRKALSQSPSKGIKKIVDENNNDISTNFISSSKPPSPRISIRDSHSITGSHDQTSFAGALNERSVSSSFQDSESLANSQPSNRPISLSTSQSQNSTSTGFSALFNSLLSKNTNYSTPSATSSITKGSTASSPIDSGYDSRNDRMQSQASEHSSSPSKKPPVDSKMPMAPPTSRQQASTKDSNSSMIARMKLKNLQEAIAKNYSPEHLAQYGIFIPGVNSSNFTPLSPTATTKTETENNPLSSNSSQSSELMNENYYRLKYDLNSGKGEPNYHTMPKNSDYQYNQQNRQMQSHPFFFSSDKIGSLYTDPKSPTMKQPPSSSSSLSSSIYYSNFYNSNAAAGAGNNYEESRSPSSSVSYPSGVSPLSPRTTTSSSPVISSSNISSSMPTSSSNNPTTTRSAVTANSSLNNNSKTPSSSSPPHAFSKYIESVHKALYGTGGGIDRVSQSPSTSAASDITTSNDMAYNANNNDIDNLNDAATLMASSSTLNKQHLPTQFDELGSLFPKPSNTFVEHRRQLFEKTLSQSSSGSSSHSVLYNSGSGNKKEATIVSKSVSNSPVKKADSLSNESSNDANSKKNVMLGDLPKSKSLYKNSNPNSSDSIGMASGVMTASNSSSALRSSSNQQQQQQQPLQSHTNRSSYKGECRRLMSRANMETVAERAAHFEDIDPDRYQRMKTKLEELDLQYEEEFRKRYPNNQPPPLGFFLNQMSNPSNINMLNSLVDSIMMQPARSKPQSSSSAVQSSTSTEAGKKNNSNNNSSQNTFRPIFDEYSMIFEDNQLVGFTGNKQNVNNVNNTSSRKNATISGVTPSSSSAAAGLTSSKSQSSGNQQSPVKSTGSNESSKNMLSQFVGGISSINEPAGSFSHFSQQMMAYLAQQQQQQQSRMMQDEALAAAYQQQLQNYHHQQHQLNQLRLMKRRSITTSPVRYAFAHKDNLPTNRQSSTNQYNPNVIMIDSRRPFQNYKDNNNNTRPASDVYGIISPDQMNREQRAAGGQRMPQFNKKSLINNSANLSYTIGSSDLGEAISTDSDIGTSPSATTLASPPSSPQQPVSIPANNQTTGYNKLNSKNYPSGQQKSDNTNNNNSASPNKNQSSSSSSSSSIIRQHSYLHAVQLNDYNNNNRQPYPESEVGPNSVDYSKDQSGNQQQQQQIYYYSPSATLAREQRNLLYLQRPPGGSEQASSLKSEILNMKKLASGASAKVSVSGTPTQNVNLTSSLKHRASHGSKPSGLLQDEITYNLKPVVGGQQDYGAIRSSQADDSSSSMDKYKHHQYRKKSLSQQDKQMGGAQLRSQTVAAVAESDENRRLSYMKATNEKPIKQPTSSPSSPPSVSSTPQSRNTSIKKLKSFFGEKAPVVLQAVENKNIIASDDYLASHILETVKEGVLNCKIVAKDGKRSSDRSWRPAWAVLKKSGALFLCKEKKDNIMIPSVDAYPINLKNSIIDIAYDYTKRKNVFKINTFSNSEYLFQTIDHDSMLEWIRAMQENCTPPDLEKLIQQQQQHLANSNNMSSTTSSPTTTSPTIAGAKPDWMVITNSSGTPGIKPSSYHSTYSEMSSPDEASSSLFSNQLLSPTTIYHHNRKAFDDLSPYRPQLAGQSNSSTNIIQHASASGGAASAASTSNRKWVRSMTRRIRDFMTNSNTGDVDSPQAAVNASQDEFNRNFGIPLDKCEPSSVSPFIPVAIEVCTRLIELHITDEGLYRKVGQKQVVTALRAQLNTGILNIDISDYNWDNPHAVVSLLKCFLNELPDSLTTSYLYNDLIQACRLEPHQTRLVAIRKLLRQLPKHNYETLKYLSAHLRRVAASYQHNKMTIKNICIAFSQSIIRHNEANCETIKTDHMLQSLLLENILVHHDWMFDTSQMDTSVPSELKDSIEQHLFQQYCSYIEPIGYTELLLNIMKSIRARWFATNSSTASSSQFNNNNNSFSLLLDDVDYNNFIINNPASSSDLRQQQQQQMNIQFRSNTNPRKSNNQNGRYRIVAQSVKKCSQPETSSNLKQSVSQSNRSKSVDTRRANLIGTHSMGMYLNSSQLSTVNSFDLATISARKANEAKSTTASHVNASDRVVHNQTESPRTTKTYSLRQLEAKNRQDRDRVSEAIKKLEVEMQNTRRELEEETDLASSHDQLTKLKSPSTYSNNNAAIKCGGVKSHISSTSSLSTSGVVANLTSSHASSASPPPTLPHNHIEENINFYDNSNHASMFTRKRPKRRHSIASINASEFLKQNRPKENHFYFNIRHERTSRKSNPSQKTKNSLVLGSKSVSHLSSSLTSTSKSRGGQLDEQVKQTVMNLSPLSSSNSSVSSSSSPDEAQILANTHTTHKTVSSTNVVTTVADAVGSICGRVALKPIDSVNSDEEANTNKFESFI